MRVVGFGRRAEGAEVEERCCNILLLPFLGLFFEGEDGGSTGRMD